MVYWIAPMLARGTSVECRETRDQGRGEGNRVLPGYGWSLMMTRSTRDSAPGGRHDRSHARACRIRCRVCHDALPPEACERVKALCIDLRRLLLCRHRESRPLQ